MWWDKLNAIGPNYGYFPKASKTTLVVKNQTLLDSAAEIFNGSGIKIVLEGKRVLGAAIGTTEFEGAYIKDKVSEWIMDLQELSSIAEEEPQIALSAFNKGLCHRWTFVQRTMSDIEDLFKPLETSIREDFKPALMTLRVGPGEKAATTPCTVWRIGDCKPCISVSGTI